MIRKGTIYNGFVSTWRCSGSRRPWRIRTKGRDRTVDKVNKVAAIMLLFYELKRLLTRIAKHQIEIKLSYCKKCKNLNNLEVNSFTNTFVPTNHSTELKMVDFRIFFWEFQFKKFKIFICLIRLDAMKNIEIFLKRK